MQINFMGAGKELAKGKEAAATTAALPSQVEPPVPPIAGLCTKQEHFKTLIEANRQVNGNR